jgi:hypothetical protein
MSTRAQSPRNSSGKKINNFNKSIINKFNFDKNKIHDILNKKESNLNVISPNNYKNKGTNLHSPICDKFKEMLLYKKIFYFFDKNNQTKIKNKSFDNAINLCYAENEKQFDEKILKHFKIFKLRKTDIDNRIEHINHSVKFIKKIFDYAFPEILINRIKNKAKMDKSEIQEKDIKKLLQQKDFKEKLRKISKQNHLLESLKIEKL